MDDTVGRETARRTIDDIVDDYQRARRDGDHRGMRRHQREETCVVLLTTLGFLAADMASFVHGMSLKGGMLMRGELGSPRTSADIDFSTGHQRRPDADAIGADLRRAGRAFDLRLDESPETTSGGFVIDFTFASRCDGGRAKLEVSVREDLVLPIRNATLLSVGLAIPPFSTPAIDLTEGLAEKLRALCQRSQPRDLYDTWFYLIRSGRHFDPRTLRTTVDRKLALTRYGRWRSGLWRTHLGDIAATWEATLGDWLTPDEMPTFSDVVEEVGRELVRLRLA
jgi:hypothetical protein